MKLVSTKLAWIKMMILLSFMVCFIKADIPVHCVSSQIAGKWIFHLGKMKEMKTPSDKYKLTCFHDIPSNEKTSYLSLNNIKKVEKEKDSELTLLPNNTVIFEKKLISKAKWTMIYDEGFEITINENEKMFAFSKYDRTREGKWVSYCHNTLIGWYYKGNKWGCFWGSKVGDNLDNPTNGEVENKLFYTQQYQTPSVPQSPGYQPSLLKTYRFTQTISESKDLLNLSSEFKDHSTFVSIINKANLSWKAKAYSALNGKTLGQIKSLIRSKKFFLGNTSFLKKNSNTIDNVIKGLNLKSLPSNGEHLLQDRKTLEQAELPTHFNWLNHVSEARSQGNCGSCYAMSFIASLEARFRIKYGKELKTYSSVFGNDLKNFLLSSEHVMKCSYYNQGCDGGYAYLVGKFFKEFELYPDQCFDSSINQCQQICKEKQLRNLNLGVSDYYYVGGAYGKASEKNIMRDLYMNGPLTISFEPEENFATYSTGVYSGLKRNVFSTINSNTSQKVLPEQKLQKPEWEKVDHSILLVGWGEEKINNEDVKFWIIQNSWGTQWGKGGFGKFLRGVDLDGIESIAEAAIPLIK